MSQSPRSSRGHSPRSHSERKHDDRSRSKSKEDTTRKVCYVGGLGSKPDEKALEKLLEQSGKVERMEFIRNPSSDECRGFAFVTFYSHEDAVKAVNDLNDTDFNDRKITV